MPLTIQRWQVLQAVTASPWTKDMRHLAPVPRFWQQRFSKKQPKYSAVQAKDRIKWWNIVPGDQVRVLGAKDGALREVFRINRFNNRVLLKREIQSNQTNDPRALRSQGSDSVHYSRCQLYAGVHKFPPAEGSTEPRNLPVFATRVSMSHPKWAPHLGRFQWDRFAENTVPRLPGWSPEEKEKIKIPWPTVVKPDVKKPTLYESDLDAVAEVTYKPPVLPSSFKAPRPRLPSEHEYIKSLQTGAAFDPSAPIEIYLEKELSPPHSRAKKQERWQSQRDEQEHRLKSWFWGSYRSSRPRKEELAEVRWKWKNEIIQERKAELQRREVVSGREAKRQAKRVRKAKKQERINRKMRALVLENAPNQVIPAAA